MKNNNASIQNNASIHKITKTFDKELRILLMSDLKSIKNNVKGIVKNIDVLSSAQLLIA